MTQMSPVMNQVAASWVRRRVLGLTQFGMIDNHATA
jgi:hypothetical protein